MTDFTEDDLPEPSGRPSKSQQKRECLALEELGEQLTALSADKLKQFQLPAELSEAISQARAITSHSALKRQRKFIGKLLRDMDTDPIREQFSYLANQSAQAVHTQHVLERWRERLLAGDDQDINAWMALHPEADRQKLRQLVRDARREKLADAAPRAARLLFKYLRELVAAKSDDSMGADE